MTRGVKSITAIALFAASVSDALARSPFDVGISEGGGSATGVFGWILTQQAAFEQGLNASVHSVAASPYAVGTLAGLSFAYGVFHAAGPGHGKAVIASYMIANEKALQRGVVLSFLAATLQGAVAIALVGLLAVVLNATARTMQGTAHTIELMSFAGIALLGLWLVWRKGQILLRAFGAGTDVNKTHVHSDHTHDHEAAPHRHGHDQAHHGAPQLDHAHESVDHIHDHHAHDHHIHDHHIHDEHVHDHHVHDEHCGHFHAPDPKTLGAEFSWRGALTTVVVAGSRPCSGAILVLVFALSQGIFWAGVVATLAMSLGTALTTGALAAIAVLFKNLAVRLLGDGSPRAALVVKGLEFVAACGVLVTGVGLFFGLASYGL